jgi:hydroxypyruvate isomerase
MAARLNARNLIVVSGDARPEADKMQQLDAIAEALRPAASIAAKAEVVLLLEPLNTLVDHRGYFLDSTADALQVIRSVDEPAARLL